MKLMSHVPPVPQPQRPVEGAEEVLGLHYADVYHSLLAIRRRAQGIEALFGPAVAREMYVDIDTALDHLRSVWSYAALAINEERSERAAHETALKEAAIETNGADDGGA